MSAKKHLPCGRERVASDLPKRSETKIKVLDRLSRSLNSYVLGKGLRQSESRLQIVEVVASLEGHFSASELIEKVRQKYPDIGAATVYRNLQTFVEAGVLRETLTLASGERVFEVESGVHHDHIVCLDCHAIFEFQSPVIEREQDQISKSMKFFPEGHRHVIYARCGMLNSVKRKGKNSG